MFKKFLLSTTVSMMTLLSVSAGHTMVTNNDDDNEAVTSQVSLTARAPSTRMREDILNAPLAKEDTEEFRDILIQPLMDFFTASTSTANRTGNGEYLSREKVSALMEAFPHLKDTFIRNVNWKAALLAGWDFKTDEDLKKEGLTRAQYDYFVNAFNAQLDTFIHQKVGALSVEIRAEAIKRDITPAQVAAYQIWKKGTFQNQMTEEYNRYKRATKALLEETRMTRNLSFNCLDLAILPSSDDWGKLSNLVMLSLSWNKLTDISTLATQKGLVALTLSDNSIRDLSILANFKRLQMLDIQRNPTLWAPIESEAPEVATARIQANRAVVTVLRARGCLVEE